MDTDARQLAAEELLRRREARQGLLAFTQYTMPQYRADPFHAMVAATLDRVIDGEIRRLMIFAPPQHGKSELVSVRLPAMWLGRRPDDPIILASYGAALAERKSRAARDVVESGDYARLFPGIHTRQDSRSVQFWCLAGHRGSMLAVGVGGPITGQGAMLGIIDDPFENWEQAQSLTIRNKTWEWWRGTYRTRIWEDGAIVLIMTRWHEDDLAGRLLMDQGDQWTVLRFPALAESQEKRDMVNRRMGLSAGEPDPLGREPGEPLAPSRYSRQALDSIRVDVGSMVWSAEYQGAPTLPEGNRFKREWFQIVDRAPTDARRIRYWDKAATEGAGAFTAGVLLAEKDGIYWVEDVVRGQWSSYNRRQIMLQTAQRDGREVRIVIEQEPGSSGKDSVQSEIRMLRGFAVFADRPTGAKDVRLEPFAAQAEAGNVRLVRGAWNGAYWEELTAIPNGPYRDQADATAGAFNQLAAMLPAESQENPFYA